MAAKIWIIIDYRFAVPRSISTENFYPMIKHLTKYEI